MPFALLVFLLFFGLLSYSIAIYAMLRASSLLED